MAKRIFMGILILFLSIGQVSFVMSEEVFAAKEKAGDKFTVRVGYFGDDKDYRVKKVFSRSEMESLPQQLNYYTNMTRVGTIMTTIAEGPTLKTLLNKSGIDIGSVRLIHLRTTDSTGDSNNWFMEFPASKYINSSLYYYPNLVDNWKKISDGVGIPKTGALKNGKRVDSIIAFKSYATKSMDEAKEISKSDMTDEDSYRFCAGQPELKENVRTSEVSSNESAKWIYGMDITLWGSPSDVSSLKLSLENKSIKVGSSKRIKATIIGQALFEEQLDGTLKWSSSNKDIATVDNNGVVTVKKEGKVKITAETKNGLKKTITINGTDSSKRSKGSGTLTKQNQGDGNADEMKGNGKKKTVSSIKAIEVALGNKIEDGVYEARPEMSEDAVELPKENVSTASILISGIGALIILILGVIFRIRRYHREV